MIWEEYLQQLQAAGAEGTRILSNLVQMMNDDPAGFARLLAEMGVEPPEVMPRGAPQPPQFQLDNPPRVITPDSSIPGGPPPLPGPGEFTPLPIPVGPAPPVPISGPSTPIPATPFERPTAGGLLEALGGLAQPGAVPGRNTVQSGEPAAQVVPAATKGPQAPEADAGNAVNWADFLSGVVAPEPPNVAIPAPPPPVTPRGIPTDNLAALFAQLLSSGSTAGRGPPTTLSDILRGIL